MLVKLLVAAGVLAAGVIGTLYAVNKTAENLALENDALPEDEQLSPEELDECLHSEFVMRAQANPVVRTVMSVVKSVLSMLKDYWDVQVKIAMAGIVLSFIPGFNVPLLALRAFWTILGYELVTRSLEELSSSKEGEQELAA